MAAVVERAGLEVALAGLPEEERVCVELRFFHDLSGREIARVLERKESTIWSRLYAGLSRLRGALDGEELR